MKSRLVEDHLLLVSEVLFGLVATVFIKDSFSKIHEHPNFQEVLRISQQAFKFRSLRIYVQVELDHSSLRIFRVNMRQVMS